MYNILKQLGALDVSYVFAKTERTPIATPPAVEFLTNMADFGGVAKHDDDFFGGDNSVPNMPFFDGGAGFITKETIDLRTFFDEGKVLDDIVIDLQRPIEIPRVISMYNIDPSAEIYETILITTDSNPNENSDLVTVTMLDDLNPNDWFLAGFSPRRVNAGAGNDEFEGISFPHQVIMAQTRIYSHDPSRTYSGTTYESHSDDENLFPTVYYETMGIQDSVVRGYPEMVYTPQINVYRIITLGYYVRTPTIVQPAVDAQAAQARFYFPPVQVSISGTMRKGTETERIMESTNILLAQPARPSSTR